MNDFWNLGSNILQHSQNWNIFWNLPFLGRSRIHCLLVSNISIQQFIYYTMQGHGNDLDYFAPTEVSLGKNLVALQVSCGFNHTGAIFEHSESWYTWASYHHSSLVQYLYGDSSLYSFYVILFMYLEHQICNRTWLHSFISLQWNTAYWQIT